MIQAININYRINARLITNFGNFVFVFFPLQGKMGKTKWKINKLLCNILATSSTKTTKYEVTKMGWNAHMSSIFVCPNNLVLQACFSVKIALKKSGMYLHFRSPHGYLRRRRIQVIQTMWQFFIWTLQVQLLWIIWGWSLRLLRLLGYCGSGSRWCCHRRKWEHNTWNKKTIS